MWRPSVVLMAAGLIAAPMCAEAWLGRMPPIEKAIYYDDAEWLARLLDEGADPNATGTLWHWDTGESDIPLIEMAAVWGRPHAVALLLEHGADPRGTNALSRTADPHIARMLLDHGADPNGPPEDRDRPLHRAALYGRPAIVKLLLRRGANIHALNSCGLSALQLAAARGHARVARLLAHEGLPWTIDAAAALGDMETLRELLADPPPNQSVEGDALAAAVRYGHVEAATILLEAGYGRPAKVVPLYSAAAFYGDSPFCCDRAATNPAARRKSVSGLLYDAVRQGNAPMVRLLIEHGAEADTVWPSPSANIGTLSPSPPDVESETSALSLAARLGHTEVVEILLEHGAQADRRLKRLFGRDETAFLEAIDRGHLATVRVLLRHGADPNGGTDPDNSGPLARAIHGTRLGIVRLLLNHGVQIPPDALYWAAAAPGNVQRLIDDRLSARGADGYTPLHAADAAAVVELLLRQGADIDAETDEGLMPIQFCQSRATARTLIRNGAAWTVEPAVILDNAAKLRELLEAGADPNATTLHGEPLIHLAAEHGSADVIRVLVEYGADVSGRSTGDIGIAPLTLALGAGRANRSEVVRTLLELGADPHLVDERDDSRPLHDASEQGYATVVRLLLEHGADVDARDIYDTTALHKAVWAGRADVARALIDHGADINARDWGDRTPLRMAEAQKHKAIAEMLRACDAEK